MLLCVLCSRPTSRSRPRYCTLVFIVLTDVFTLGYGPLAPRTVCACVPVSSRPSCAMCAFLCLPQAKSLLHLLMSSPRRQVGYCARLTVLFVECMKAPYAPYVQLVVSRVPGQFPSD